MNLKKESVEKRKKEIKIQEELYKCIDAKQSILFNAGAGSGKTYALKECLKYVVNRYGKGLKYHNQKVICITYTNVAANEIKQRLGNTSTVLVSTIHERIWDLIKNYQSELLEIHITKLLTEIKKIENNISTKREYEEYRKLNERDKCIFQEKILLCKNIYYENYGEKKEKIQAVLKPYLEDFFYMTDKIGNFKKTVKAIFDLDNYITKTSHTDSVC